MNNIQIANETKKITEEKQYSVNGNAVTLPDMDYSEVTVYSPQKVEQMLSTQGEINGEMCKISITNQDSFEAAADFKECCVLNFANAHNPGGGFMLGANAQEEALCRCSTLYKSISGEKATEMYKFNNFHIHKMESDYMLFSKVCVFRDKEGTLMEKPFVTSVISAPAPNRIGAAIVASDDEIDETMIRRMKIVFLIAAENGCRNLILGAWGCGAFHNKPDHIAEDFRKVLVDEGYGKMFDEIRFAIYGAKDGSNITSFKECFK